jgi:hypothetical protein
MSATVLRFPTPKYQGTQKRPSGPVEERLYFCTACSSRKFFVDLDGQVWCSSCSGWINNLRVT